MKCNGRESVGITTIFLNTGHLGNIYLEWVFATRVNHKNAM